MVTVVEVVLEEDVEEAVTVVEAVVVEVSRTL